MTTFTMADRLEAEAIALKDQIPIQTKFGALYYEIPYRGESTCSSCGVTCGYIHGTKHELPCPNAHNELPK